MFINQLHRNILNQLKNFPNVTLKSSREQMNLFLNGENPDKVIAACQQIFGIQNLSLAIKVENDLDTIKKAALFVLREAENPDTFKVSTTRSNKEFSYNTYQVKDEDSTQLLI